MESSTNTLSIASRTRCRPPKHIVFHSSQIMTEDTQTYALIYTFIKAPAQCKYQLDAVETISCVKQKANWTICWIVDQNSMFSKRLVAMYTLIRLKPLIEAGEYCVSVKFNIISTLCENRCTKWLQNSDSS
jgi:hypothetical protein